MPEEQHDTAIRGRGGEHGASLSENIQTRNDAPILTHPGGKGRAGERGAISNLAVRIYIKILNASLRFSNDCLAPLTRIFLSLSVVATIALIANLFVGLLTGDYQTVVREQIAASKEYKQKQKDRSATKEEIAAAREKFLKLETDHKPYHAWIAVHVFLGCAAAILTTLVNSVAITYFVGTSRWIKEVVDAYGMDPKLEQQGQRIKRGSFAWSVAGMLAVVSLVFFGGAADPRGANYAYSAHFVLPHYLLAFVVIAFVLLSFWKQWTKIAVNYRLIAEIMAEVQRIKQARADAKNPAGKDARA